MKREGLKQVIDLTKLLTVVFGILFLTIGQFIAGTGLAWGESRFSDLSLGAFKGTERKNLEVIVTGTVTDVNGVPIPGVTVSVPGTTIGTATDLNGRYSLSVPEGADRKSVV